jgi:hypothetical protein
LRFIKPLGEDSTPVTVKPLRVSLVEPVACRLSHKPTYRSSSGGAKPIETNVPR